MPSSAYPPVGNPAVMLLAPDRDILPDGDLVHVECRVDPDRPPLEQVIRRRALLIEVIEGHVVRVVLATARDPEVGLPHLGGAEHRLPPVRPAAGWHDQTAGVGIGARIDIRAGLGVVNWPARVRPDVCGNRGVVGITPINVCRDGQAGILIALLDDLIILQGIGDEEIVHAADRRGHTAPDIQRHRVMRSRSAPFRFNDHDPIPSPRTINGSGRRILQDLYFSDVIGIQPVDIRVRNGCPVDDIERIVVLERADPPDPDGAA